MPIESKVYALESAINIIFVSQNQRLNFENQLLITNAIIDFVDSDVSF